MKFAPNGYQHSPQRGVIRNAGKANGAEIDCLEGRESGYAVFRHDAPRGPELGAIPREFGPREVDTNAPCGSLDHALALGHDFLPNTVAGDYGNTVRWHIVDTSTLRS